MCRFLFVLLAIVALATFVGPAATGQGLDLYLPIVRNDGEHVATVTPTPPPTIIDTPTPLTILFA
jgi:hypothetical protein